MAEAAWPFYGVETSEAQFSKWAAMLIESGIAYGLAVTPGTGMQVSVSAGMGAVQGVAFENDAAAVKTVGAAPGTAGQTRRDYLILRLDQTANSITLVVKAGTANTSGGALPALTQNSTTWEIAIAIITVAYGNATVTAGMISELKPSTGLRVLPYTTATRPTPPANRPAIGVNTQTGEIEIWSGTAWSALQIGGVVPLAKGGTGATTAAAARTALGVPATSHTHDYATQVTGKPTTFPPSAHSHAYADVTGKPSEFPPSSHSLDSHSGTLGLGKGGTGQTSAKEALKALGIYVQPTAPAHLKGRVWIPGTAPD